MSNSKLDPKLYDLLVDAGIIDPSNVLERSSREQTRDIQRRMLDKRITEKQKHEVYIIYKLNPFLLFLLILSAIVVGLIVGVGLVYFLT